LSELTIKWFREDMAISAGVPNDHLYVEVKTKEQPSFKPCSGKAALDSSNYRSIGKKVEITKKG
jgi:hypothetical protein